MSVASLEFLLCILLAPVVFVLLPGTRLKQLAFAACSVAFLFSYIPDLRSWAVLAVFLLSGYGCAILLRTRPSRVLFTTYLFFLIVAFAFLKKYVFLNALVPERMLNLRIEIVGLSYMLFRQIHFIVDSMQGQIERPTVWTYLNYQLNPFTLLAGPIQRYQDFHEYWKGPLPLELDRHEVLKIYFRLFVGLIKIVVISPIFQSGFNLFLRQLEQPVVASQSGWIAVAKLLLMLYCYAFYLYMNFSGYCDVVIAGASLVGLRLPENFNAPFLSRNMLDYWTRWHITLGHWIRDYLFTPFYKAGAERFPGHTTTVVVAAYLVAFALAGIWHGSTWNYLIYGLMEGAGVSAVKLWEVALVKRGGRAYLKKYLQSAAVRRVAVFGTFNYACLALFFFALDLNQGRQVLGKVIKSFASGY
jgi:alginate O-acetyltransferase complex protein AlgI